MTLSDTNTCLFDSEKKTLFELFYGSQTPTLTHTAHVCLLKACHQRFDHCDVFILSPWRDECHRHLTHHLGKQHSRAYPRYLHICTHRNYDPAINSVSLWHLGKTFVHRINIWHRHYAKQVLGKNIRTSCEVFWMFVPSISFQLDEWHSFELDNLGVKEARSNTPDAE